MLKIKTKLYIIFIVMQSLRTELSSETIKGIVL